MADTQQSIDYKEYNLNSFKTFIGKILNRKFKGDFSFSEIKKQVDTILEKETARLTAHSFYKVLKVLQEDIDKSCLNFFKDHPAKSLPSVNSSKNKLDNLFTPLINSQRELSKACSIKMTRLSEVFDKRFNELYAYEAFGLSKAVDIKPSQLFEYFYGYGERPIIGLVPTLEENNKATEQQVTEGENTEE